MPGNHRIITNASDWMRDIERRLTHEERRPRVSQASDLMGPGLGPHAVQTNDWSGPDTEFNGYFYSPPGTRNAPDGTRWWMGYSITQADGFGVQHVWDYRGTTSPVEAKTRRFSFTGGMRVFSTWA